jgi:hypothetical protein
MARRVTLNPLQKIATNGSLVNMSDANVSNLPESYRDIAAQLYSTASGQYNTGSFHARHPVASNFINAGIGLLSGNPANIVGTPIAGARQEAQRKLAVSKAYQDAMTALSQQQQNLLPTQEASNRGAALNTLLENSGYQSPLASNSVIDQATVKDILNGVLAEDTANAAMTRQTNALKTGVGIGQEIITGVSRTPAEMKAPAGRDISNGQSAISEDAPLQGNIKKSPLALPQYRNPDIVKAGLDNANASTIAGFNGLPEYQKLPFETQKLIDEAFASNALGKQRQQETITETLKPLLIRSQVNENNANASLRNRTDPNLRTPRAPNIIDLMTPEQRAAYAARTAAGTNPDDGYESVTYDENGKVKATTSSRRIRGGNAGGALPSKRPMINGIPIE